MNMHRKDLPPPPKNQSEVLRHEYMSSFKAAEIKVFNTLINKDLFPKINNAELKHLEANHQVDSEVPLLALMWVYSYKFDVNGYLLSFKARLAVRGDLQLITDENYAAT